MKATAFTTPSLRVRRYVCMCVTSSAPWFTSLTFPSGPMCLQLVGGYSEILYNICEGRGGEEAKSQWSGDQATLPV